MKKMKKYRLSETMKENYSVEDLENYLKQNRKIFLKFEKITAIKERITELKKENEKFFEEIQKSNLFKLAGKLLTMQVDLKKIFMLSYEEAKERERKLLKKHLTEVEYNRRTEEMRTYIDNIEGRPYVKISHDYIITHPIIFDVMIAIVNEAHNKDLHDLINGKNNI